MARIQTPYGTFEVPNAEGEPVDNPNMVTPDAPPPGATNFDGSPVTPAQWATMSALQREYAVNGGTGSQSRTPSKTLTASQVTTAIRRGAVDRETARAYLLQNGYDEAEADALIGSIPAPSGSGGGGRTLPRDASGLTPAQAAAAADRQADNDYRDRVYADRQAQTAAEMDYRRERAVIDDEFRKAEMAFRQAVDARDFEAQQYWKQKGQDLALRRADLDDKQFQLTADVQTAASRRSDMTANLDRNRSVGYVVDAAGTGIEAGTVLADEVQRRYERNRTTSQDALKAIQDERARRERAGAMAMQLEQQAVQNQGAQDARDEQRRQFDVSLQAQAAARLRPRVLSQPPAPSRIVAGM